MIAILVVDDHTIVRAGLKQFLADHKEFAVAGEASSGAEALEMVRESDWGLVLLDISMPGMNGIDTLRQIKLCKPALPVLILSMHPEEHYGIHVIRAGASGYLHKGCTPHTLITAIITVAAGEQYVTPALAQQLGDAIVGDEVIEPHQQLSQREFQVFCKLAAGRGVADTARELSLNRKTVSTYRTRLLEKMGLETNAQLTLYAIQHELIA